MINWRIAKNPLNWLIVLLMFYIGFYGVNIVSEYVKKETI